LLRDLTFYREGPDLLPRLVGHPAFFRLDAVMFFNCGILTTELGTLASSMYAASLRSLSLQGSRLSGPDVPGACVQLLGLPRLTHLNLNAPGVCPRGPRQRLPPPPLGDEAVAALAQSPSFSRLRVFDVHATGITDAVVPAVAFSPYLACSEGLYLDYTEI